MYNPNIAPQTIEEWNQLIQYKVNEQKTIYDTAVAEAKAQATINWNEILPTKKEELLKEMSKTEADLVLAKEKQEYLDQAISIVEQPMSQNQIEITYAFLKPALITDSEPIVDTMSTSIINLDGKYWDIATGKFIDSSEVDQNRVIIIGTEPTLENLQKFIAYEHSRNAVIPLVTEQVIKEEKFKMLRAARIPLLEEYDAKVMQLGRLIRDDPDNSDTYTAKISEWDSYATELANITEKPGAPWDGGGSATPWPVKPE